MRSMLVYLRPAPSLGCVCAEINPESMKAVVKMVIFGTIRIFCTECLPEYREARQEEIKDGLSLTFGLSRQNGILFDSGRLC